MSIRVAGEISLIFALIVAFTQSIVPLLGYSLKNHYALHCARTSALAQFFFVLIVYIFLTIAFGTNDFSIAYVAANSHPSLPMMYRLTAVWGAHEGSILLWILILNIWTIIFVLYSSNKRTLPKEFSPLVIAVLGLISFCFLCFLLLTSNPFLAATVSQAANDLNPLLQDPGFVIHPPMLYTGYVGFSAAFAITVAALLRGKLDATWSTITRQFAMAAWCFLTFGITLGSWWAYRVLGWGGFWFWDPVENASLLPWLAGTALIHVLTLADKRNTAKNWAALLAIISFALSLLGTFLVRSGVLISAHTFANDPARGVFLLFLLAFVMIGALILYIVRVTQFTKENANHFSWSSREMSLLINSGLFFIAMLTILLGTIYPLIIDALHLGAVSIGAPYFNMVMMPLVFIIMFFMGFAPLTRFQAPPLHEAWKQVATRAMISSASAIALLWYFTSHIDVTVAISLSLSFWIILSVISVFRINRAMSIAHIGFAVLVIGIMLSSLLKEERDVRVQPGDIVNLGPYQFLFIDTTGVQGPNYRGIQAAFEVTKDNRFITNMYPEKRIFTVRDMVMTKVDIAPGIFRDLYVALGEPLDQHYWSVRLYYKPFIRWIWLGGLIMMIGGLFTMWPQRITTKTSN